MREECRLHDSGHETGANGKAFENRRQARLTAGTSGGLAQLVTVLTIQGGKSVEECSYAIAPAKAAGVAAIRLGIAGSQQRRIQLPHKLRRTGTKAGGGLQRLNLGPRC